MRQTVVESSSAKADGSTTATAGDALDLAGLMDLLVDAEISLGGYTDEELAVVAPNDPDPLVPYPFVELLGDSEVRTTVMAAALRSLIARGLLVPDSEPGAFQPAGALGTLLALRFQPSFVLVVERVSEHDPTRWVVYGVGTDDASAVLEEAIAPVGHHTFIIRSVQGEAQVLGDELARRMGAHQGPGDSNAELEDGELDKLLAALTSVTRLYALRMDGDEFLEIEAVLVEGGGGTATLLYQPRTDNKEEHLLVLPSGFSPAALLECLMQFDLTAVNEAID